MKFHEILENPDLIISVSGIVAAASLIVRSLVIGSVISAFVGLLICLAILLWIVSRKTISILPEQTTKGGEIRRTRIFFLASSLFFLVYILSIILYYARPSPYQRPLIYFLCLALMAGLLTLEIGVSHKSHTPLILAQIVLMGTNLAWSQIFLYPGLIGWDPWYHQWVTNTIMDSSFIPKNQGYSNFPIFHLYAAFAGLIMDLKYKLAIVLSVSIAQIILNAIFVYLLSVRLIKRYRLGLVAALLLVIAPSSIYMSYWSIPNAFAGIFILIILYSLYQYAARREVFIFIAALSMGTLILTHTITSLCMAILLFVVWGAFAYYNTLHPEQSTNFSFGIPVIYTAAVLVWWTYDHGAITTLSDLLSNAFAADYFSTSPAGLAGNRLTTPYEDLFNSIGKYSFVLLSLTGLCFMVSKKGTPLTFNVSMLVFTLLGIVMVSLSGVLSIIEHRWWYFAEILMSVPLAYTLFILGKGSLSDKTFRSYIPIFVIIFLTFFSIMSPDANIDNRTFSSNFSTRYSLSESEIAAVESISQVWNGTISTDNYYAASFNSTGYQMQNFDYELYSGELIRLNRSFILVSDNIVQKPFLIYSDMYKFDRDINEDFEELGYSRVYMSNIRGYLYLR